MNRLSSTGQTSSKVILRPSLAEVLKETLEAPLTLVSAPAGYGKSLGLKQSVAANNLKCVWFDVARQHSSLSVFVHDLLISADSELPGIFQPSIELLEKNADLSAILLAKSFAADALRLNEVSVIVFDDFHLIRPGIVEGFLEELIRQLPASLKVILISRIDPPLPIPLWRSRGLLREIRSNDLRFSLAETSELLSEFALDRQELEKILEKTEGWPLALSMLRISMGRANDAREFVKNFSTTDRLIFDFLADEVIRGISPDLLDFLCGTAILKRFSAELCDEVFRVPFQVSNSRELLMNIEHSNLFLQCISSDGKWFRYHHLFEDLLETLAGERFDKAMRRGFHFSAAQWFSRAGLLRDAVRQFLLAEDIESADEVLEQNFQSLAFYPMSRTELRRLMAEFTDVPYSSNPIRPLALATLKIPTWDLEGQKLLLKEAETLAGRLPEAFTCERKDNFSKIFETTRAFNFFWTGDHQLSLDSAIRSRSLSTPDDPYSYDLSIVYESISRFALGQEDGAFRMLSNAIEEDCSRGSKRSPLFMLFDAGLKLFSGELDLMVDSAQMLLRLSDQIKVDPYYTGYATYFLGLAAFERNTLADARSYFEEVRSCRYAINCRVAHDAILGLGKLAMIEGDFDLADRFMAEARAYALEMCDPISLKASQSFEKKLALVTGKPVHLEVPETQRYIHSHWLVTPHMTEAEVVANMGSSSQVAKVLQFVDTHISLANSANNTWLTVKFEALRSVILAILGEEKSAENHLMGLLRQRRTRHFVRTFVDRGPVMHELLARLRKHHNGTVRVQQILDAFSHPNPTQYSPLSNSDVSHREIHWLTHNSEKELSTQTEYSLTNREMDVLLLLGKRLTQKEVATELNISRETVKKHTTSLYQKLNVHHRSDAIKVLSSNDG